MKTNDNGTERDMTADEETAHVAFAVVSQAAAEAQDKAAAAKAKARQIVLDRLGITADEAQLLLG